MPISEDEFEKYKTPLNYVIEFLKKNQGVAFTAEEIAERVEIDKRVIINILNYVPLAEVLAMSKGIEVPLKSVTISNVAYYKYNEKYPG